MDRELFKKELIRDEGIRREPYYDTEGHLTVGIGFNLDAHKLPDGVTYPLSDAEIDQLYQITADEVLGGISNYFPWWNDLDDVRQRVIANMVFNMGVNGVALFKNTIAYIKAGEYEKAASNMRKSKWFKQVKGRAVRLCKAMESGVMPNA